MLHLHHRGYLDLLYQLADQDSLPREHAGVQPHDRERPIDQVPHSLQAPFEHCARTARSPDAAVPQRFAGERGSAEEVAELVSEESEILRRPLGIRCDGVDLLEAAEFTHGVGDRVVEAHVQVRNSLELIEAVRSTAIIVMV